jgi:Secretion system C-terminal sorting domain
MKRLLQHFFFFLLLAFLSVQASAMLNSSDTLAKFNFCYDASWDVDGWTSVYGTDSSPVETDNDITIIIDGGYLSLGHSGMPVSTAVPDLVSNTYNWMSNENETPVQIIISGLDQARTHDFHIYASRDSATAAGDRTTTYTVVGTSNSGSINPVGNSSQFVDLLDVTPSATGSVVIELTKLAGQYGYINAMIICADADATALEEADYPDISFYPNPVKDHLHITNLPAMSNVCISDITGRRILEQFSEEQVLSVDLSVLNSGIYIIQVENSGEVIRSFKVIKR